MKKLKNNLFGRAIKSDLVTNAKKIKTASSSTLLAKKPSPKEPSKGQEPTPLKDVWKPVL